MKCLYNFSLVLYSTELIQTKHDTFSLISWGADQSWKRTVSMSINSCSYVLELSLSTIFSDHLYLLCSSSIPILYFPKTPLLTMFFRQPYLLCSSIISIYHFPKPSPSTMLLNHPYLLFSKTITIGYLLQPYLSTIYWSHLFWEVCFKKILGNAWVLGSSPKTVQHIFERWPITTWILKSFWHL